MAQPVVGQLVVNTDRQQQIEPIASSPEGLGESHGTLSLPLVSALLTPMMLMGIIEELCTTVHLRMLGSTN